MKISELRKKLPSELEKLLGEERERLRSFRFKRVGGELKNVRDLAKTRQTIARILTMFGESNERDEVNKKEKPSQRLGKPTVS